jgi:hypothetical protein
MALRRSFRVVLVLAVLIGVAPAPSPAVAYRSGPRWQPEFFPSYSNVVQYVIEPGLTGQLNTRAGSAVADAVPVIQAASLQWSQPTPLSLQYNSGWDPNFPVTIRAWDFTAGNVPLACGVDNFMYAATCERGDPQNANPEFTGYLTRNRTLFNISNGYRWNTNNIHGPQVINGQGVNQSDLYTVILHEFGHVLSLDHEDRQGYTPNVMNFSGNVLRQALEEDDKQGVVQLYGPWTGWESSAHQAVGLSNTVALYQRNNPDARLWNEVANESLVPVGTQTVQTVAGPYQVVPFTGTRQVQFTGVAQTSNAYAYMALFSAERDGKNLSFYTWITDGMHLTWKQNNAIQETMSVDIQFGDNTWMRDEPERCDAERCYPYTDNYGGYIHPAERDTRFDRAHIWTERKGWFSYDIDLSPFAGKRIQQIVIAYDNTRNGTTGPFHAFIDDLRLIPPGGQATLGTDTIGSGTIAVTPPGNVFPTGTTVTLNPQPSSNNVFRYWIIDGIANGWPSGSVSLTLKHNHTATAVFAPLASFNDIATSPYFTAIQQIASRRIALGYTDAACQQRGLAPPCFVPNDGVLRAQMAAFIARGVEGWDIEDWGNTFSDGGGIDADLWRNVGTLQHYGVANGYDAATCAARGVAHPCFGPNDPVTNAQSITFITRAMVNQGLWDPQPGQTIPYAGVPSVHLDDVKTFYYYTQDRGGVPDAGGWGPTQWNNTSSRGWFAEAEWRTLNDYYSDAANVQSAVVGTNTFSDEFATKNTSAWSWSTYQTVPFTVDWSPAVKSVGSGTGYQSTFWRTGTLTSRKVIELRFKVTGTNTQAHFAVDDGAGRRFGAIAAGGRLYPYYNDGAGFVYPANSDLFTSLQVDTWYILRITIDDTGGFRVWAWPEHQPHQIGSYGRKMTPGRPWKFQHWIYRDIAYIDNYREFTP